MVIKHIEFKHGVYYMYRYHEKRILEFKSSFPQLTEFLTQIPDTCPHKYFEIGPRSSSLNFKLKLKTFPVEGHEISKIASEAFQLGTSEKAPNDTDLFLLQHDDKT